MTKKTAKRNEWNWGISAKPKRTNAIIIVRFVSVIFKLFSLCGFTFLDCIFFFYNWIETWAFIVVNSYFVTLVFCDSGRSDVKAEAINSSAEKINSINKLLKLCSMLDLQFNYTNMSPIPRYFNLNCGMRKEYSDDFFWSKLKFDHYLTTSMIFFINYSGP